MLCMSVFHWQFLIIYIFSVSLKFRAYYITGQWREFSINNATLCLHILYDIFFLPFIKRLCFDHFHFFFWWSIKFTQQNINQSQAGVGDKKLSLKLHSINFATFSRDKKNLFQARFFILWDLQRFQNHRICHLKKKKMLWQ